jgi:hypothetical protein
MKATHVLLLRDWVKQNRSWVLQERPKMTEVREKAEGDLGFKCPPGPICDCMDAEGLPRRLSKDAAKLQGLTEERDKYRAAFYKLLTITSVNAHLAAELRDILAFDAEVAELLQKKKVS